jgi:rod shape-determining protein MreB
MTKNTNLQKGSDMVTKLGLDLGYANITISDASFDVYREPSVAIIDKNTHRIISVGREALTYDGAGEGILVRPFKNGLLYSAEFTEEIIKAALKAINTSENVRCILGVPDYFNSKQESELSSILEAEGVRECFFVKRAVAGLIGAGYAPSISAVSVNIGASATEIAVLYKGSVIYSSSVEIGGEDFDEAVKSYILEQGDLNISLIDARAIKESIGAVWEGLNAPPITISGTLALTGNKIKMSVASEDILGVFEKPLHKLLSAVADGVKKIPTDYVEEIFANGIVLSGGGAQLYGLDKMMSRVFDIDVSLATNPADSVARGLSIINSFLPIKMRSNGKNITVQLAKFYKANNKNS